MNNWYVCVFCNKRKSENLEPPIYTNKSFGVCPVCLKDLPFCDGDGCFEGTKYINYLISDFYYTSKIKHSIHQYKFNQKKIYADIFSCFLINRLKEYPLINELDYVTCVPLSKKRFNERGYNQSELIAQKVANNFNIPFSNTILKRTRNTKKQSGLKGAARLYNVLDAFEATENLTNAKILLFDDVFTVGFTLNECAKVLKSAGAQEIVGAVVAMIHR